MEINCGSVKLTTPQHSLLTCAGGEAALAAAALVSELVKAQLALSAALFQVIFNKINFYFFLRKSCTDFAITWKNILFLFLSLKETQIWKFYYTNNLFYGADLLLIIW